MAEEHPLDKLLLNGKVIDDRYAIIEPLENQGSYSRMYWVENKRLGGRDLMKVNLSTEFVAGNLSARAQRGLEKLSPEVRASNEARLVNLLGGRNLPQIRDMVHLPRGLEGVVYAAGNLRPLDSLRTELAWWRPGFEAPPHWIYHGELIDSADPFWRAEILLSVLAAPRELKNAIYAQSIEPGDFMMSASGIVRPLRTSGMHWLAIVHNDIKPGNILVDDVYYQHLKRHVPDDKAPIWVDAPAEPFYLIDYGLALTDATRPYGTVDYIPDHGLMFDNHPGIFGSGSYSDPRSFLPGVPTRFPLPYQDAWSIGAICYEMLTGKPFKNDEFAHMVRENADSPAELKAGCLQLMNSRRKDMWDELVNMQKGMLRLLVTNVYEEPVAHHKLMQLDQLDYFERSDLETAVRQEVFAARDLPFPFSSMVFEPRGILKMTEGFAQAVRSWHSRRVAKRSGIREGWDVKRLWDLYFRVYKDELDYPMLEIRDRIHELNFPSIVSAPHLLEEEAHARLSVKNRR